MSRNHQGSRNPAWKGGRREASSGYILVWAPGHPRAAKNFVLEHVLIVEAALGHYLPNGAQVHHVNGTTTDNVPPNLVLCPDMAYHRLLELRQRALDACGNANWRACVYCRRHDDPAHMAIHSAKKTPRYYHRACSRKPDRLADGMVAA